MHENIIASLTAAGADASILDTNGNSAQDFHLQRPHGGADQAGGVGGGTSGAGRLEPSLSSSKSRKPGVPMAGGERVLDEL